MDLKDTAGRRGAYARGINIGKFQANAFAYAAPAVNDSKVKPLHLNATLWHFIDLQGKWTGRFKYTEYGSSSNGYHLGGAAYCF